MDPFSWAMLIMSALSTASALNKPDIETEDAAPIAGIDPANLGSIISPPSDPLAAVSNLPGLEGPTKAAAAAAKGTPQTKVTTGPQIPAPNQAAVAKAATQGKVEIQNPELPALVGPDIGQVLAAIPDALVAVAPLLGLTDQNLRQQRPAPISGSPGGGLVGRFAQAPGGIDIGQLLAALPGIR